MQTTFQKLQEKFFRWVASSFVNHVMIILFSFTLSLKNTLFPIYTFYKYDNVYPQRVSLDISESTQLILLHILNGVTNWLDVFYTNDPCIPYYLNIISPLGEYRYKRFLFCKKVNHASSTRLSQTFQRILVPKFF